MPPVSRNLRETLEHQLGPEATDELLSLMPPDWTQLATKSDLEALGTELRGDMNGLRSEMGGLRSEMDGLRSEVRGEIAALRSEVRGEIAALRGDMAAQRGELLATLHQELRKQTFFYVGSLMTLAGVVLGTQVLN